MSHGWQRLEVVTIPPAGWHITPFPHTIPDLCCCTACVFAGAFVLISSTYVHAWLCHHRDYCMRSRCGSI
jgi:hypothetical protein